MAIVAECLSWGIWKGGTVALACTFLSNGRVCVQGVGGRGVWSASRAQAYEEWCWNSPMSQINSAVHGCSPPCFSALMWLLTYYVIIWGQGCPSVDTALLSHCTLGWFIPGGGKGLPEIQGMGEYLKKNEKRNRWVIYIEGYQNTMNLWGIKGRNEDDKPLIFAVVYSNRRIRNGLIALQWGISGPLGHLALSRENVTVPYLSHVFGSFGTSCWGRLWSKWRVVSSTQANTRQWCMFNI